MTDAGPYPWNQAARALESTWNHASTSFSHLQHEAAHAIDGRMRRVAMRSRQHAERLREQLMARQGPTVLARELWSHKSSAHVIILQAGCGWCAALCDGLLVARSTPPPNIVYNSKPKRQHDPALEPRCMTPACDGGLQRAAVRGGVSGRQAA